jgi:hypothetical protein
VVRVVRCFVVLCSTVRVVWCGVVWCGACSVVWCRLELVDQVTVIPDLRFVDQALAHADSLQESVRFVRLYVRSRNERVL